MFKKKNHSKPKQEYPRSSPKSFSRGKTSGRNDRFESRSSGKPFDGRKRRETTDDGSFESKPYRFSGSSGSSSSSRGRSGDRFSRGRTSGHNDRFESRAGGRSFDGRKRRETTDDGSFESKPYLLLGIRPLEEAIRRGVKFNRLHLRKQEKKDFEVFIHYCKEHKIPFFFVDEKELDEMSGRQNHQGVVAELMKDTRLIPDLKKYLEKQSQDENADKPTHQREIVLILDRITDQQNVGAIARSAYFFGCKLIITEQTHSAPIDAVVHKTSSGASLMVSFHLAKSMTEAVNVLKADGFEILAATSKEAIPINQLSKDLGNELGKELAEDGVEKVAPVGNFALILGSEGKGIRPHLERMADRRITIPQLNDFDSLNVSVATGIILYALSEAGQ